MAKASELYYDKTTGSLEDDKPLLLETAAMPVYGEYLQPRQPSERPPEPLLQSTETPNNAGRTQSSSRSKYSNGVLHALLEQSKGQTVLLAELLHVSKAH